MGLIMNERQTLNLAALAATVTLILAIFGGWALRGKIKEYKEQKIQETAEGVIRHISELHTMPFDSLRAKVSMPFTRRIYTRDSDSIIYKGIRLANDSCLVVDIEYFGHYGEYTKNYSTFLPDIDDENYPEYAFDLLINNLECDYRLEDEVYDYQIRDWCIANNRRLVFKTEKCIDHQSNNHPFCIIGTIGKISFERYGDPHKCGKEWDNDLDSEVVNACNDAVIEVYQELYPGEMQGYRVTKYKL